MSNKFDYLDSRTRSELLEHNGILIDIRGYLKDENYELRELLYKAKTLLLQWSPEDAWFPEIKYQFSKFIEKIQEQLNDQ